jgi:hypothetical protein
VEQERELSPAFMKQYPIRSIGTNASTGSMGGLPKKRARLTGDIIDRDDLFGPTVSAEESRNRFAIRLAAKNAGKDGKARDSDRASTR